MSTFRAEIPGEPHAQARRVVTALMREGKPVMKDGRPVLVQYDPKGSKNWKATAQHHLRLARGAEPPLVGPVWLVIVAYFTCPLSQHRVTVPRPQRWHTKRPDLDNVVKAVKDAAKGVLWLDDSQVAVLEAVKLVCRQGDAPRVAVTLRALSDAAAASWQPIHAGPGPSG